MMLDPYGFALVLLQNPPPLFMTSRSLISWQLASDCEQDIPQFDDYRRYPSALDKYAFLATKENSSCNLSHWRHSIGISWIENIKDPIIKLLPQVWPRL